MKILLTCEYLKTRRKYVFLTMLAVMAVLLTFSFYGKHTDDSISKGWMMLLYQLPMVNTIFIPVLSIVTASQLCDVEHKGMMLKQLFPIIPKKKIYDAKLIYGLLILTGAILIEFAAALAMGQVQGYGGSPPIKLYCIFFLFTLCPTITIYILQHTLSLLFKNQAVPFFIGILGEFCGLLSMFLPQVPWLNKMILWGHYGALQFVGNDWNAETRISNFYLVDFNWQAFALTIAAALILYLTGYKLFCEREV